jgi:hypothetical protein
MSAILQVIGRELRVRALVPATGAATAVAILIAGWLVADGTRFREIAESSLPFASFFLVAGAVYVGALLLARDLEGSRSLFWLARPVGAWTAFGGKMTAAFLLVVATTFLAALPAFIVDAGLLREPLVFAGAAGFAVGCIALGAALGLLLRNRSAWFIPALAILVGFGGGVWLNAEPFLLASAGGIVALLFSVGVAALVLALILAHGLAFARGRHDARAQARIFTLLLAIFLGAVLAVSWGFGAWVRGLDLSDLDSSRVRSSAGSVAVVEGWRGEPVPWGRLFAVDVERGRSVPLAPGTWITAASPQRVFYAAPVSIDRVGFEIFAAELGSEPRTRRTGIVIAGHAGRMVAAPDGSRVAVSGPESTQVFDLAGRSLGSFPNEVRESSAWRFGWVTPVFIDRDTLRLYERASTKNDEIMVREADLRSRSVRRVGTIPGAIRGFTPAQDRVVVRADRASSSWQPSAPVALHDARSGEKIFDFPPGTGSMVPLSDGGWAVGRNVDGKGQIVRLGSGGEMVSSAPFNSGWTFFGGEVRPGVISVGESFEKRGERNKDLLLVDVGSGRVLERVEGVTSIGSHFWMDAFDEPGSVGARMFTRGGELHQIDGRTLEGKKIEIR